MNLKNIYEEYFQVVINYFKARILFYTTLYKSVKFSSTDLLLYNHLACRSTAFFLLILPLIWSNP